jgi:hypothetical protein
MAMASPPRVGLGTGSSEPLGQIRCRGQEVSYDRAMFRWLYNLYVSCYNAWVDRYNARVDWHNQHVIVPQTGVEIENARIGAENAEVDEWNNSPE